MDYITPISSLLNNIIDRVWPDKTEAERLELELAIKQASGEIDLLTKQIEVNIEEAKSSNLFVAGWRPFIGWICGISFAYHFIVLPVIVLFGVPMPVFDTQSLLTVLLGMLGLGGMRTFEKVKGVARK